MAVQRDGEEDFGCFETVIALVGFVEPGRNLIMTGLIQHGT